MDSYGEIAQAVGIPAAIIFALGWFLMRVWWPYYVGTQAELRAAQATERTAHLATLEKQAADFKDVNSSTAAAFDRAIDRMAENMSARDEAWQAATGARDAEWQRFLAAQQAATTERANRVEAVMLQVVAKMEAESK